jgi:hypothetical protein
MQPSRSCKVRHVQSQDPSPPLRPRPMIVTSTSLVVGRIRADAGRDEGDWNNNPFCQRISMNHPFSRPCLCSLSFGCYSLSVSRSHSEPATPSLVCHPPIEIWSIVSEHSIRIKRRRSARSPGPACVADFFFGAWCLGSVAAHSCASCLSQRQAVFVGSCVSPCRLLQSPAR